MIGYPSFYESCFSCKVKVKLEFHFYHGNFVDKVLTNFKMTQMEQVLFHFNNIKFQKLYIYIYIYIIFNIYIIFKLINKFNIYLFIIKVP
jgi:hypothetical protein